MCQSDDAKYNELASMEQQSAEYLNQTIQLN